MLRHYLDASARLQGHLFRWIHAINWTYCLAYSAGPKGIPSRSQASRIMSAITTLSHFLAFSLTHIALKRCCAIRGFLWRSADITGRIAVWTGCVGFSLRGSEVIGRILKKVDRPEAALRCVGGQRNKYLFDEDNIATNFHEARLFLWYIVGIEPGSLANRIDATQCPGANRDEERMIKEKYRSINLMQCGTYQRPVNIFLKSFRPVPGWQWNERIKGK